MYHIYTSDQRVYKFNLDRNIIKLPSKTIYTSTNEEDVGKKKKDAVCQTLTQTLDIINFLIPTNLIAKQCNCSF